MNIASENRNLDEDRRTVRNFRLIALAVVLMLIIGSVSYHYIEGWNMLDSVYFCVVSLATVGYGDLAPTTNFGKLFTIFYLIIGISIFAAFANTLIKSRVARHSLKDTPKKNLKK